MKKQLIAIPLLLISLSSCTHSFGKNNDGLVDQENINIVSDINELAINTFLKSNNNSITDMIVDEENNLNENSTPKVKSDVKEDIIKNLEKYAANDPKAQWVYDNFFNITNVEAYLTGNDPDTIEFVYNMNHNITDFPKTPGESIKLERKTPYYIQWDNRWAYDALGSRNIGISGCGPTSTAMVLSRLKNDPSITPDKISRDAKNYMSNEGVSWLFFPDEAKKYNLSSKDIAVNEKEMIDALKKGPLIVSVNRGYFTLFGHIFVIDSYKDGKFLVNDPNSVKNSMRPWSFDEISNQIAHIWQIY
ncbi:MULTISPECIES: C39 family peptidase [Anaerococcus]|uniref:C39 family peptidase n=1 Tax=Anaerococcus TaxID=165779 RepID=UPI0027BA1841|nr:MULTISPECIES: C39 family peptidase [Anaerococcus]MDU2599798.1 C39 family peptidase [Anaerococcus sp.]